MSKGRILKNLSRSIRSGFEYQKHDLHTTISSSTRAAVVQARLDKNRNLLPPLRSVAWLVGCLQALSSKGFADSPLPPPLPPLSTWLNIIISIFKFRLG